MRNREVSKFLDQMNKLNSMTNDPFAKIMRDLAIIKWMLRVNLLAVTV